MENKEIIPQCLEYIDPIGLDYLDWCNVGMALKEEGFDVSIWDEWSKKDPNRYRGFNESQTKWDGFKGKGLTGATIVKMAKDRGWQPERKSKTEFRCSGHKVSISFSEPLPSENIVQEGWIEKEDFKEPTDKEWNPIKDVTDYLTALFDPSDIIGYVMQSRYIQDRNKYIPADKGTYTVTCGDVLDELNKTKSIEKAFGSYDKKGGAWIRFNALDGKGVKNDNVVEFKYALIESDNMDLSTQLAVIKELKLPCAAIMYSGGKSVHAIVHIDAHSYSEYRSRVEHLFKICEKNGLSLDKQNKNPSRLSRLPGCYRGEHKQFLIATNQGLGDYVEWSDYIDELDDNLPDIESIDNLLVEPPVLAPMMIDGMLRKGRKMILTAPSKAGKTHLLIDLAYAFVEGMNWLGHKCKKSRVLYVNLEVANDAFIKDVFAQYLMKGAIGDDNHWKDFMIWNLRGKAQEIDKLKHSIIRKVKANKIDVLFLDPIYKIMIGEENSNTDVGRFCRELDDIVQETGVTIVYAHHFAKGSSASKSVYDKGAGAGAFSRDADVVVSLDQLDWYSVNDPQKKAWRLSNGPREFGAIEPTNLFSYGASKDYKGKTYSTLVFGKDNGHILDSAKVLETGNPNKKTQYEIADDKEHTDKVMEELGGKCTLKQFCEKSEELFNGEISSTTAKRRLESAGYSQIGSVGSAKLYGLAEKE